MIYALRELGNVHEGQTVLLHSAAGGCGTFGLGICKKLNAKVIATVGHEHKVTLLILEVPYYQLNQIGAVNEVGTYI